jgi:hypothetical protein
MENPLRSTFAEREIGATACLQKRRAAHQIEH